MLGEAISKNPGYLKLRKLKASQTIAKTVSHPCLCVTRVKVLKITSNDDCKCKLLNFKPT